MTTGKLGVFMVDPFFSQLRVELTIHLDKEISRTAVNRNSQLARIEAFHLIDDAEFAPAFGVFLMGPRYCLIPHLSENGPTRGWEPHISTPPLIGTAALNMSL